jgi:hypothetical protein
MQAKECWIDPIVIKKATYFFIGVKLSGLKIKNAERENRLIALLIKNLSG